MTDDAGATAPGDAPSVGPAQLQRAVDAGEPVRVLDLRDRDEVQQWRLSGPSVALTQRPNNRFLQARVTDSLDEFVDGVGGEGPITVVCARGEASADVAAELAAAGHDARNLAGGMAGWARLLQSSALDAALPGDASLVQYRRPASGCLGYLVASDGEAAVVDPLRAFTDRYVEDAADLDADVRWAVDTHVHADHVSGLRSLAAAADAEAVVPAAAVERGVEYDVREVTEGDELRVGEAALEAVGAPGHTTGMTAFAVGGALLTGDSLFVDSVARPDLERGADGAADLARDLYRTLTERFDRFPDETLVAPGHHGEGAAAGTDGVTASLGDCRGLPAFRMTEAEFVDYVTGDLPPRPANFERIVAINLGRESADRDEAFELELGPNNCAATPARAD